MLLTPHIIRTSEITEADLRPIYIGSQGNLGIGGPPPLIAGTPEAEVAPPAAQAPATPGTPSPTGGGTIIAPPGSSPVPGTIFVPTPTPPPTPPGGAAVTPPAGTPSPGTVDVTPPTPAGAAATTPSPGPFNPPVAPTSPGAAAPGAGAGAAGASSPGIGSAQVILTPPGTTFRVGGGPYTVPISITNASRVSMVTLTVTFDPALLRVRAVNEGSFMRSGGASAVFTQQASPGRVDITITRSSDATGATGTGLLGAILFDAVAPGSATMSVSGTATGPGGTAMGLQFRPVTVTIQ
jgi:hypothetical protein